jgi:hypothetical protein
MIRSADYKDTKVIVELLQHFMKETAYGHANVAGNDVEHLSKIAWMVLQHGRVWLAEVDGTPAGLLLAVVEPNMWAPRVRQLRELCWFVLPEYRNTLVGGRLFKKYCEYGDSLMETGKINQYFTTIMSTTETIDLGRRGFRSTEQTFIKELKGE